MFSVKSIGLIGFSSIAIPGYAMYTQVNDSYDTPNYEQVLSTVFMPESNIVQMKKSFEVLTDTLTLLNK
eukprot:Pgem_evm1s10190